jgi:hypothetical protein
VTILAHDAALAGLSVDTTRLYDGDDPYYELWLSALIDRLIETKRSAAAAQKSKTR